MPCYGLLLDLVCLFQANGLQSHVFISAITQNLNFFPMHAFARRTIHNLLVSRTLLTLAEACVKFNQLARCSDYDLISDVFRRFVEIRTPTDMCVLVDSENKCYPDDNHIVSPEERAAN